MNDNAMNAPQSPSAARIKDDEIDLLALVGILLDYKWLIVAVTFFFAALGVAYVILAQPVYQADSVIQIEGKKAGLPGLEDLAELTGKDPEAVTEIEIVKSRWVVGRAVDSLHLDIFALPQRFPIIGNFFARRYKPEQPGDVATPLLPFSGSYDWGGAKLMVSRLDVPPGLMGFPLTLVAAENGRYTLLDPDNAKILEGTVGQLAVGRNVTLVVESLVARPGQQFTVGRNTRLATIDNFRDAMVVAERGRNTGIVGLSYQHTDPAYARQVLDEIARQYVQQNVERMSEEAANSVQFIRDQLPTVRQEMERAAAALNAFQVNSKSVDITVETTSVLDQIVELDSSLSEMKLKQLEMEKRFTKEHPNYQALLQQMEQVKAKKTLLEKQVADLPETQQQLLRLNRDVQVSTQLYTLLLNKSQEMDIVRAGTVGNARIIDYAEVDVTSPVKPKKLLVVLLAAVFGGVIGVVLTGLHVALTRGIEDPTDIESLGVPVHATIPYSSLQDELEKSTGTISLLSLTHPTDPAIEAIRSLRTSLHFLMMDAPSNIMSISGPSPQVGKTFISANMAVTMAQAGKRVLLMDADMRKGYMQRFFNLESSQVGLSNLLGKTAVLENAVIHTAVPGLDFIARGPVPPNPSELLLSPLFGQLLKHLSAEYDLLIIDTPPILAVADSLIVSKLAGANFIVTRFSKNPLGEVQATIRRFENNGVKLDGAILNATHKRSLAYYGYQKYGYGNYQYHYYGVDESKGKEKRSKKKQ